MEKKKLEFSDEYKTFETLNDVQTKLFIKRHRRDNGIYDVMYHSATGSNTYPLYRDKSSADKKANAINAYNGMQLQNSINNLNKPATYTQIGNFIYK